MVMLGPAPLHAPLMYICRVIWCFQPKLLSKCLQFSQNVCRFVVFDQVGAQKNLPKVGSISPTGSIGLRFPGILKTSEINQRCLGLT